MAVWFHGNAEVIDQLVGSREVEMIRRRGCAVLLVEYPGYGNAQGTPSQASIVRSAKELVEMAAARPEIDEDRVVYIGRSLGGGVACALAAERPPRAIVLITTFTSVASFATGYGLPEFVVRHPFRNDRVLAEFDRPVLILHGDRDEIVPVEHGRALARAARRATYVEVQGAGHLDALAEWPEFAREVPAFLRAAGITAP